MLTREQNDAIFGPSIRVFRVKHVPRRILRFNPSHPAICVATKRGDLSPVLID
jgi:hypothetical protein